MPYPSSTTYPGASVFPGLDAPLAPDTDRWPLVYGTQWELITSSARWDLDTDASRWQTAS